MLMLSFLIYSSTVFFFLSFFFHNINPSSYRHQSLQCRWNCCSPFPLPKFWSPPHTHTSPHGKYSQIHVGQSLGRMTSTRPDWQMPPMEVLLQALESNTQGIVMMRGVVVVGGGWALCVFRNDIPLSLWRRSMNNQHWNPGGVCHHDRAVLWNNTESNFILDCLNEVWSFA